MARADEALMPMKMTVTLVLALSVAGCGAAHRAPPSTARAQTPIAPEPRPPRSSDEFPDQPLEVEAPPSRAGYLTPEQIMEIVRAEQADVRHCFEVVLEEAPSLCGRIEIAWRIALDGTVSSSQLARSTMGSTQVEQCIVDEVASWVFDRPDGGEVDVVFPFIFGHAPSYACPAAPVAGP